MLVDGCHKDAEGPSVKGAGAYLIDAEVFFLAFDGTFGTGAIVLVGLPKWGVSGDGGAQPGVCLRIGVDGASVGGGGAWLSKRAWLWRGEGECWAAPF